jgi:ubiquinone/menaquinone biosynthesis C-methylase UbiE
MKNLCFRVYFTAIVLISIFTNSLFSDQKSEVQVEAWEVRLNKLQPPKIIMDTIGLKEGMSIGDIGAGKGRFSVWFADRVGENGKVYANDISQKAFNHLNRRIKNNDIKNVVTILGKVDNPCFEENSLDIAFMINVYHHLEKPVELVKNIIPSLKSDGILAIVEHETQKSGYPLHESTPKQQMLEELNLSGFEIIRIESFLEKDLIYVCKPQKIN